MKFTEWISSFFGVGQDSIPVDQKELSCEETKLAIEVFAISSAINLIASAISKCEFKTYLKYAESKADEYYLWNIEPNKNQNSSQFLQALVTKLLYNNECLVLDVGGQLIIADSFYQNEYAVVENYFTSVTSGTMCFNRSFKMSEVLYFKLGDNDIRVLLSNVIKGYSNLTNMAMGKYNRSGGRKGILDIDATATGDKNFQTKFDDLMNVRFKSYFEAENAVLPLHKGYKYTEQGGEAGKKSSSEITDIVALTKEIFDKVAQAFKIPPSLLRGDISDIGSLTDNLLTFCIDPLVDMMSEETNRKRYGKVPYLSGSYLKIDTTCIRHIDLFSISVAFDKLIASGGYSINDLRVKCGDTKIEEGWADQHYITKNYEKIEALGQEVKGG